MKDKKSLIFDIGIIVLFALITLNTVLHHEIWADEAQAWLLVKNLSVPGLFKHLVNEGHPSFFYLLNMPFAKLNFSIFAMQIICWLGTVGGAFMILRFSPFSKFAKFSILASAGFLYFFPVIARSYSILPLLVCLAAFLYTKNKQYPLIYAIILAMIANTHVIMFAFSAILGLIFLYDNLIKSWQSYDEKHKRENTISICIIFFGLLAVVLQLCGTIGSSSAIGFSLSEFTKGLRVFGSEFFINIIDNTVVKTHAIYMPALVGIIILVFSTAVSLVMLALTNLRAFLTAFLAIGFQFMIYIVSYHSYIYPSRIACAYLILIFAFWITLANPDFKEKLKVINKKTMNIILAAMFFVTILNGLRYTVSDLFNNYSSSKDTAVYIQKKIPSDAFIITTNDPFSLGIYYYAPRNRIWSIMKKKYIKYVVWDDSLTLTFVTKDWSKLIKKNFNKTEKTKGIYIINSSFLDYSPYELFSDKDFELVYQSPPAIADGEAFRIYKYIGK